MHRNVCREGNVGEGDGTRDVGEKDVEKRGRRGGGCRRRGISGMVGV